MANGNDAILEINDLCVSYGPIRALENISLRVDSGEIVSILGANGAGKSSLLRTISGLVRASSGKITHESVEITRMRPERIVARKIAHAPEGRHIFPDLTVEENLRMGAYLITNESEIKNGIEKAFHYFPALKERYSQQGGTLSGGEQQMLAVARALMISPRVLMLDEPSLGLAPMIIDQIFEIITRINREDNVTILLVEQNANEALLHSNRAYVLENGRITLHGRAEELHKNPKVVEAYLGG